MPSTHEQEETDMTQQPDHELEVLETDQDVPPRPEEEIADSAPGGVPAVD